MKRWLVVGWLFSVAPVWAGAVPSQITYQGTLKQTGAAANGSYSMVFRLTDSTGLTQYWSSGPMNVTVTQGLFTAVLAPVGVDWQNVTPFIEVNVNGQTLSPREPVHSAPYALMCGSVADGSVLSGMIAMFDGSCPTGWNRFAALDGVFPMGSSSAGATGGSAAHSHQLITTRVAVAGGSSTVGIAQGGHELASWSGGSNFAIEAKGDLTDTRNHLPPYRTMVFCQKQ